MRTPFALLLITCAAACATACGSASDLPPPDPLAPNAQTPPVEQVALDAWLAAGTYKDWNCETTAHEARPGSGHDRNRICTNTLQSTHTSTAPYPVGAASVKELIDDDGNVEGYAVYLRADEGDGGEKRFWYEVIGGDVIAIGYGHTTCTGCHGGAPRDFVFTQIR